MGADNLKWWVASGRYAEMLVAADSEERAIELARAADEWDLDFTIPEEPGVVSGYVVPPVPPIAEGVYAEFAE